MNKFFAVIHCVRNYDHTYSNTKIAFNCGASGVVFIPDYMRSKEKADQKNLDFFGKRFKKVFPDFTFGVNYLNPFCTEQEEFSFQWFDVLPSGSVYREGVKIYGSAAFKYTENERLTGEPLHSHCLEVSSACHVVVTSGSATGCPPPINKIGEIKGYIGDKPLAIASGVDVTNVQALIDAGASEFLVASSLLQETSNIGLDEFDPKKVEKLARLILG